MSKTNAVIYRSTIESPVGPLSLGTLLYNDQKESVCFLEFDNPKLDNPNRIDQHLKRIKTHGCFSDLEQRQAPKKHSLHALVLDQLGDYFDGNRQEFDIPLYPFGTDFQKKVWQSLCDIPFGETLSYGVQAEHINNPKAVRAVALANSQNPISILIPCHRVIGKSGSLTGYAGGLHRKQVLLELEQLL